MITVASSAHASADLTDGWIANRARYDRRVAYANAVRRELISASRGADTVVYLAVSDRGAQLNGCHLREREVVAPSALADDLEVGEAFWNLSDRLVGLRR